MDKAENKQQKIWRQEK